MKAYWFTCALLLSLAAFAQTPQPAEEKKNESWTRHISEKFSIRYFSEFLGPNLETFNGELTDVDSKGNYYDSPEPAQLWNQIAFGWQATETWRFLIAPRFMLQLGPRDELGSDDSLFRTEDFLVAAQGTIWKDGPWSLWARPGYRLPTSRFTRDAGWNGVAESLFIVDRTSPDTRWGFGMWMLARFYMPTGETTNERWRLYNAPYVAYIFSDKWKGELYYETEVQHNEVRGKRAYNYGRQTLQGAMLGATYTVSPSLSLFPFLKFYTVRKIDPATIGGGLWISAHLF